MEDIYKLKPEQFPEVLNEIPQPPKSLYIRGKLPDKDVIYLAVVGSRKYTSYGKEVCEKLIRGLKGYPIVIVSGLAIGIDTIAHTTALNTGLTTISFPGSGLDNSVLHPRTNIKLAQEIINKGGCLISEMDPSWKATLYSFSFIWIPINFFEAILSSFACALLSPRRCLCQPELETTFESVSFLLCAMFVSLVYFPVLHIH